MQPVIIPDNVKFIPGKYLNNMKDNPHTGTTIMSPG